MRSICRRFAAIVLTILFCGCSSSPNAPADKRINDRSNDFAPGADYQLDGGKPDAPKGDSRRNDGPVGDGWLPASALQAVVNTITLPTSGSQYAHDFDGSGAKNRLGDIIQVLSSAGFAGASFQDNIDALLKNGLFLLLFDVLAKSITNDANARLRAWQGYDLDTPANAADNFSGSESFGILATSPTNLLLSATITSGKMSAGPGVLLAPIPIGSTPTLVSLLKSEVIADLSTTPLSAMTNGRIYGAIAWTDVDQKIIPAMAAEVDQTYNNPATPPDVKASIKNMLDTNADGTITADELRKNALLTLFLAPDVDTDGDKKSDALSAGMAFTAVACTIK